jgi:hypothetical protein
MAKNSSSKAKTNKRYRFRYRLSWRFWVLLVLLVFLYNNYSLKVTKETIESDRVSNNIKIAVMSDYHAFYVGVPNLAVYATLRLENPDIVAFMGDMYSNGSSEYLVDKAVNFMTTIASMGYTCYFVNGEHDNNEQYFQALEDGGVNVLHYETDTITVDDTTIDIYGIDNVYFSETFDLHNEFSSPDPNTFSILLAHIPMYDYYQSFGTDLTICGDTHGGLVQIPFLGCLYYEGEILPELKGDSTEVRDKGLFSYEGGNMFITSGLGNYPLPVRFNNRPEVAILTIEPS